MDIPFPVYDKFVINWKRSSPRVGARDHRPARPGDRERLKTIELIVQRKFRRAATASHTARQVSVRIGWHETALRQRVKAAGGGWHPVARVRVVRRDHAERLGLLGRAVVRRRGG